MPMACTVRKGWSMRSALALGVLLSSFAAACSEGTDGPHANPDQDLGAEAKPDAKKASPADPASASSAASPNVAAPPAEPAPVVFTEPVLGANPTVLLTCTKQGDPSSSAYLALDDQKIFQWKIGAEQHTGTLFRANGFAYDGKTSVTFESSSGHRVNVSLPEGEIEIFGQPKFTCDPSTIKADAAFLLDLGTKAYNKNAVWTGYTMCAPYPGGAPMGTAVTDTLDGRGLLFWQTENPSLKLLMLEATAMTTNAAGDIIYSGHGVRQINAQSAGDELVRFTALQVHKNADGSTVITWVAENAADNVVFEGCGDLQGEAYANEIWDANTKK
jgi:hypothetical protein